MARPIHIFIASDPHFAGKAERARGWPEYSVISNPLLRLFVRCYRYFIWRRDPFGHNDAVDRFIKQARQADHVILNGDYSCDTAFIGVSDDASYESASECLGKFSEPFGSRLFTVMGDHELGKVSLFGGRGGIRLASWHRATTELDIQPYWEFSIGKYLLIGISSSLVALPVFDLEILDAERQAWNDLRDSHLSLIRSAFETHAGNKRIILFCHDPTALPFLLKDKVIAPRLTALEMTIIGHLHSSLFLWKSRLLAGMPIIRRFGPAVQRMSTALQEAKSWKPFHVRLIPALGGIELLKDGGYGELILDPTGDAIAALTIHRFSAGSP